MRKSHRHELSTDDLGRGVESLLSSSPTEAMAREWVFLAAGGGELLEVSATCRLVSQPSRLLIGNGSNTIAELEPSNLVAVFESPAGRLRWAKRTLMKPAPGWWRAVDHTASCLRCRHSPTTVSRPGTRHSPHRGGTEDELGGRLSASG